MQYPYVKVSFCLTSESEELTPADITAEMNLLPTRARVPEQFPVPDFACTGWIYEEEKENCYSVSKIFHELISKLVGKESIIQRICTKFAARACFVVVIHAYDGDNPEVTIPREVVQFAASINAEICFDLYYYVDNRQ